MADRRSSACGPARVSSADFDAGDSDSVRDPLGRARERKAERDRGEENECNRRGCPAAGGAGPAGL